MSADQSVYGFEARTIDGMTHRLDEYRGQVLLIVNVASRCGFTPQYRGLERLYADNRERGLVILGFPCNQFGRQEPGTASEIREFCWREYRITFPLFERIDVNGSGAHPLYRFLTATRPGLFRSRAIKWNFTKFLIDRDGRVRGRYAPWRTPARLQSAVDQLL